MLRMQAKYGAMVIAPYGETSVPAMVRAPRTALTSQSAGMLSVLTSSVAFMGSASGMSKPCWPTLKPGGRAVVAAGIALQTQKWALDHLASACAGQDERAPSRVG